MPLATSGGASNIDTTKIVDGTIIDDDVASDAAILQSKIDGFAEDGNDLITIEPITSTTTSVTTDGSTKLLVLVTAQLRCNTSPGFYTITLSYDGVAKETKTIGYDGGANGNYMSLVCSYTETPAADTANIVLASSGGTLSNVRGYILKFRLD